MPAESEYTMSEDNACMGIEMPGAAAEAPARGGPGADGAPGPGGVPAESMRRFTRFVGLDVHKRTVMACVLDGSGHKVHQEEFACTPGELGRFARSHLGPHAAVALEATSNTWAVCNALRPWCGAVKVSNPLDKEKGTFSILASCSIGMYCTADAEGRKGREGRGGISRAQPGQRPHAAVP